MKDLRIDKVYLIVTVNVRANKYDLRMKEPKSLQPNQTCLPIEININLEDWFHRIEDVRQLAPKPPLKPNIALEREHISFGKTTSEKVIDRLAGR